MKTSLIVISRIGRARAFMIARKRGMRMCMQFSDKCCCCSSRKVLQVY